MSVASLPGHSMMIMGGLFAAFAIKMPVFPLHTWQPDTYTTSPTQGTMLLSGIMLKMGGYGAIRWMLPLVSPYHFGQYQMLFVILAVIGIVYASIIAIMQDDMKRLIAYSSIAHVGLIAAGVWVTNTEGLQGAMIQMVSHGINVVGLFYAVDIIERRTGTRSLAALGGLARTAPVFAALFMVVVLGATAVPLTNGFVGEFLLLSGVYKFNLYLVIVAGLTVILCSVYMLRLYGLAMFGETKPAYAGFKDLSATEMAVMGIVAILVILIGVAPQPLLDLTRTAATHLLQTLPH
jgi:NADH-quinone oxidoreductase subunit M